MSVVFIFYKVDLHLVISMLVSTINNGLLQGMDLLSRSMILLGRMIHVSSGLIF